MAAVCAGRGRSLFYDWSDMDGPPPCAVSRRRGEDAWKAGESGQYGNTDLSDGLIEFAICFSDGLIEFVIGLSDGLIEFAMTHEEINIAFLTFQKDADQIYPGWKETLTYTDESTVETASFDRAKPTSAATFVGAGVAQEGSVASQPLDQSRRFADLSLDETTPIRHGKQVPAAYVVDGCGMTCSFLTLASSADDSHALFDRGKLDLNATSYVYKEFLDKGGTSEFINDKPACESLYEDVGKPMKVGKELRGRILGPPLMLAQLADVGVTVPGDFSTAPHAYKEFPDKCGMETILNYDTLAADTKAFVDVRGTGYPSSAEFIKFVLNNAIGMHPESYINQLNDCIPEAVQAMRAAISETGNGKLFSANTTADDPNEMITHGNYHLSQFGSLLENCALLAYTNLLFDQFDYNTFDGHGMLPSFPTWTIGTYQGTGEIGYGKIYDLYMPPAFLRLYDGPAVNVEDMRHILGKGTQNGGLREGAIIKLKPGLPPKPCGGGCYAFWPVGDFVMNDEPQGHPVFCQCIPEVVEDMGAATRETGHGTPLSTNIAEDDPNEMTARGKYCLSQPQFGPFMVDGYVAGGTAETCARRHFPQQFLHYRRVKVNGNKTINGGEQLEPDAENLLIGFSGRGRYMDPFFEECLAMELEAMKRVCGDMGLENVELMTPLVCALDAAKDVNELTEKHNLKHGEDDPQANTMALLLNVNACITEDFTEFADALVYYIDRDSEEMMIAYSNLLFDRNVFDGHGMMPSLPTLTIGTCQGTGKIEHGKIYDLYMPPAFLRLYGGPAVNVEVMWRMLGKGTQNGGLKTGTIIKLKLGLQLKPFGEACHAFRQARDIINEEPQGHQVFCQLNECIPEVVKDMRAAIKETGNGTLLSTNITADDCGQGLSDHLDLAGWLLDQGIVSCPCVRTP